MWIFSLYLACCTALAVAHPFEKLDGRIVGGEDVEITEVPHQGSLLYYKRHICGASIISEEFLVTAGHCVNGFPTSNLEVRIGSSWLNKGGSVHKVIKVIEHKHYNYNSTSFNDIALLQVFPAIHFDSTRQPIQLYDQNEASTPGKKANVTGWGRTSAGGQLSNQLQVVTVPIVSKGVCGKLYAPTPLPIGQICAGNLEGGKDSCQGDSGGPLTIGGRLAGIVSWGRGCAYPEYPGVYTEVAYYREWIRLNAHV